VKRAAIFLLVVLLIGAGFLEWGIDTRSPAAVQHENGEFSNAARIFDFLGGVRQYLAYTLFIKTDKLSHSYALSLNDPELAPYFVLVTMLDSHYVSSYYLAAGMIFDLGREEEAIDFLREGIAANPDSGDLYFSLGISYLKEKRYPEAAEAFEKAIQLETTIVSRVLIIEGLVTCYKKMGQDEKAIKLLVMAGTSLSVASLVTDLADTDLKNLVNAINTYWSSAYGPP
jgi:tetratricopeptide (TPR) repeat protein